MNLSIVFPILDYIGDIISIQDTAFRILYQNRKAKDVIGDHVGEYCYEAYEQRSQVCKGCPVSLAFRDRKIHTAERSARINDQKSYVEITASPLTDSKGKIMAGIEVVREVTERNRAEALLRQSRKDWENIFNTISDMITIHDRDFNVVFANASAEKTLGLPARNAARIKCYEYYHGKTCPPAGCPSCECLQTKRAAGFELFEPHLNMFIEIRCLPRFDSRKRFKGLIHIVRDITQRTQTEAELTNSRQELRNLTAHLQSVREKERAHIAREIHDELAQDLTAIKIDLFWLNSKLPAENQLLRGKTKAMSKIIDSAIDTVRKISSELRPKLLDDLGLQAAMEWQAGEFYRRTGIKCDIISKINDGSLSREYVTAIFRIFQETLTNIARHAKATRVNIVLGKKADSLRLEVRDNGRGITKRQISDPESFGLMGMRERAAFCGGTVSIRGVHGKGTSVTVSLPFSGAGDKKK